jgi:hypothetical protein
MLKITGLAGRATARSRSQLERQAPGRAMEPASQGLRSSNRRSLASQHQEGRLEHIFGILLVAKHGSADAKDHATVPADQRSKSGFIPIRDETLKQVRIREKSVLLGSHQLADVPQQSIASFRSHGLSPQVSGCFHYIVPGWPRERIMILGHFVIRSSIDRTASRGRVVGERFIESPLQNEWGCCSRAWRKRPSCKT